MKPAGLSPAAWAALAAALLVGRVSAFAPAPPPKAPPEKIVFTSMSEDAKKVGVFVMNADGTGRTTLTKEGAVEIDPALSPAGQRIAFVVVSKDDMKGDLWVMNADGTGRKQLTQNKAKTMAISPAWSPDGKHIAFTRTSADGLHGPPTDAEIVVTDADGKNEKSVGKGLFPAWSPDGRQILYTTIEKGGDFEPRLNVMDADGQNAKKILDMPSMMGAFSPDGKRIAFMGAPTTRNTQPRIHVCKADGSEPAQATKAAEGFEVGPRWSADGKRIFFSRMPKADNGPSGKSTILVMDADGGNEKELTKGDAMDMLGGAALFLMEKVGSAPAKKP